jgi:hypothetical protein
MRLKLPVRIVRYLLVPVSIFFIVSIASNFMGLSKEAEDYCERRYFLS